MPIHQELLEERQLHTKNLFAHIGSRRVTTKKKLSDFWNRYTVDVKFGRGLKMGQYVAGDVFEDTLCPNIMRMIVMYVHNSPTSTMYTHYSHVDTGKKWATLLSPMWEDGMSDLVRCTGCCISTLLFLFGILLLLFFRELFFLSFRSCLEALSLGACPLVLAQVPGRVHDDPAPRELAHLLRAVGIRLADFLVADPINLPLVLLTAVRARFVHRCFLVAPFMSRPRIHQ